MSDMDKKEIGNKGEAFAAEYYRKKGYAVAAVNYHSRYGEIDVIAENGTHLVFIEVKTRKDGSRVAPSESVDRRKRKKLILTAMKYLSDIDSEKQPRFDVFEVWQHDGRVYKVNCIESAFDVGEYTAGYDIF